MAEIDPYATLGVQRTATRDEIARAYRTLAKRYHPDAGAEPSPTMARINEAWHVLSDPNRRSRWDRLHASFATPHWAPAPAAGVPIRRPSTPAPPAPTTLRDSPWFAAGAVAGAIVLVGVALLGISAVGGFQGSAPASATIDLGSIQMEVPADWTLARGDADGGAHRVVAHLVSFPVVDDELCTAFGAPCALSDGQIPPGEASVLITAWSGDQPPVPEPLVPLPAGLQADRMIGGQPAAFELRRTDDGVVAWWQLSPPGFPERWFEVRADIGGRELDRDDIFAAVDAMVESIRFVEEGSS